MGLRSNLIVLSLVAATVLGLPHPDEYQIPDVGNNRRSQYYVLHEDGSHKYGYDTGDNAFESLKTNSDGEVDGKFGYTDSDGHQYRVQYTSGSGGFVAQGDHIPQVHPDVAAAFATARAAGPFEDPLAGVDADRSFNFGFDGEEYSRNEVSNSDGTVTGSYSYIDEFGRTRTYTYRAGKGIGFEIIGDDIPVPVQPLASHTEFARQRASGISSPTIGHSHGSSAISSASRGSVGSNRATFGARGTTRVNQGSTTRGTTHTTRRQQQGSAAFSAHQQPLSQTYIAPTTSNNAASFSASRQSAGQHSTTRQRTPSTTRTAATGTSRQFEAANTRTSFSPRGSYSLAYETSSHSRQEAGDDDNNVKGQFTFTADDDGEDRTLTYEAGSATGFITAGTHLPIGPSVPGAYSGQVTGRLEPVEEIEFIDPLADEDTDSSYNFGFDSDSYSRSETADEDGNVSGTYSVLGEDNILRTFKFRAGKGIGYEVEEVSAVPSRTRASSSTTRQQSATFSHGGSSAAGVSSGDRLSHGSAATAGFPRRGSSTATGLTYQAPQISSHASRASAQSTFSTGTTFAAARTGGSSSDSSVESFPNFELHQYHPSEGRGKYGYVIKYD